MKISILGAGVGGLSTAIALRQKGFDVDIYERHSALSDIGAGIVCWPNASFVLNELGLLDEVSAVSGLPVKMQRYSNEGEHLGTLDILKLNTLMGYPSLSVLRKDLMKVLERCVVSLGIDIHYGHTVEALVPGSDNAAVIQFADGSIAKSDLIIGADGRMNSVARGYVNGDNAPVFQGFINWIGVFESEMPVFDEIAVNDYWGVGERFGIVPVSAHKAYWAGAVATKDIGDKAPERYRSELQSLFGHWPEPIARIIEETPLSNINKLYVHDHNPLNCWHRDNVLLIGDAAHAPLPTSGQGACQALEDGWHLARILADTDGRVDSAIQSFTELRRSKTTAITMAARQLAQSLFNTDAQYCQQRNMNSLAADYDAVVEGVARYWGEGLPIGE